jgi:hypothetical protein
MGMVKHSLDGIFLCDNCDTLAIVWQKGNTIEIKKCECVTLDWESDNV